MRELLERSVAEHGVVVTWDAVIRPVLAGIGERHAATKRLIEVEHLFSRTTTEVLAAVPRPRDGSRPARILLACADEEQHSLPLEAMAAALAEEGVPTRLLGARVPTAALAEAIERIGPAVVVLWAHSPATGDVDQLQAVLHGPNRPMLVIAGGPGWPVHELPPDVAAPSSLGEALWLASGGGASLA
jgi:hypothetical protein